MDQKTTSTPEYLDHYYEKGYTVIKNLYSSEEVAELQQAADDLKSAGLKHDTSFRHKNLLYLIQQDPNLGKVLRFCHWPSYAFPVFARYRNDPHLMALLKPIIGDNIKQVTNQVIWKTPGAVKTSYGFHQDARFRRPASAFRNMEDSYVQTFLAIDRHTTENGCIVLIEGSHKLGDLDHYTDKSVFDEDLTEGALESLGIGHLHKVEIQLDPGDIVIWSAYLLHGSGSNSSTGDRRVYTNGYMTAENCDRGEWAFRDGKPVPLGEPVLVQYDDLFTRPEPHYIHGAPHPVREK